MGVSSLLTLSLVLLTSLVDPSSSQSQTCTGDSLTGTGPSQYRSCTDLAVLNCFLYWNHNSSTGDLGLAFRCPKSESQWVAWAINPTKPQMVGSQSLLAFLNGSRPVAYTTSINSGSPSMARSALSFQVPSVNATYSSGTMTIFAELKLTPGQEVINQVWQRGPVSSSGVPSIHSLTGDNLKSVGTLDLTSGAASLSGSSSLRRKNVHGVLNVVSWGMLMPIGVMMARYVKVFPSADPAWFYLHISCQISGYIIGVAGWGTGLKLGSDSKATTYTSHRNIGITLFCFATLQVFALLLRPNKDHKYRLYWTIYHQGVGYTVIVMSIVNIFKGLDILNPADKWKNAYLGVLISLGAIALILEAFTWFLVLTRKKVDQEDKSHHHHPPPTHARP